MNDHPGMNVHFVQVYFVQVTYAINTNTKQTGCRQNTVIVKTSTMSSKIILIRGGTNRQRDRQTDRLMELSSALCSDVVYGEKLVLGFRLLQLFL